MAEPQASAAASAAIAAAGAASAAALPDHIVIAGSLIGALVSVWISRQRQPEPWSWAGAGRVLGHLGVSSTCGIVLSIVLFSLAPHYAWAAPAVHVPQWTVAAIIAAVIHVVAPLGFTFISGIANRGGKNAANP